MAQVETPFLGDGVNAPLSHRQSAKQNLDAPAIFVLADLVHHQGMSRDGMTLDLRLEQRCTRTLLHAAVQCGANRMKGRCLSELVRHHIEDVGAADSRVEQRPTLPSVNSDHLTHSSHDASFVFSHRCVASAPAANPTQQDAPLTESS